MAVHAKTLDLHQARILIPLHDVPNLLKLGLTLVLFLSRRVPDVIHLSGGVL